MLKTWSCVIGVLVVCPAPAWTQELADEMAVLRREVAALRAEVALLRGELTSRTPGATMAPTTPAPPAAPPAPTLEMMQAQLAEHAQTKVESGSRLPLKLSGSIVSTTFLNSGTPNWLDLPNINRPPTDADQGSFSSTLRQSRIGVETAGLAIGDWQASGAILFDFFGGIPSFQTGQVMGLPRMLYAFARIEGARGGVLVGQDEAVVAPRSPTSLGSVAFPAFFRSGNLYLRVPQVRGDVRLPLGEASSLRVVGGLAAPVAGDFTTGSYVFDPPELSGERAERPAVQGRAVFEHARDESHVMAIGLSGHQSATELASRSDAWVGAVDFDVQWGAIGAAGEGFVSDDGRAFGAGLSQAQARSRGGWLEVRVTPSHTWRFVVGAGTDQVTRRVATSVLRRNTSGLAGVRYAWTPELALGFEYFLLETSPFAGPARRNHNLNWTLRYDF